MGGAAARCLTSLLWDDGATGLGERAGALAAAEPFTSRDSLWPTGVLVTEITWSRDGAVFPSGVTAASAVAVADEVLVLTLGLALDLLEALLALAEGLVEAEAETEAEAEAEGEGEGARLRDNSTRSTERLALTDLVEDPVPVEAEAEADPTLLLVALDDLLLPPAPTPASPLDTGLRLDD